MDTNNWYIRGKSGCGKLVKQKLIESGAIIDVDSFNYSSKDYIYFIIDGMVFCLFSDSDAGRYIIRKWEEVKVGEAKPKRTFKPYDKVLMCDGEGEGEKAFWLATEFACYNPNDAEHYYRAINGNTYSHCLPYEGNEHLNGVKFKPEHIEGYEWGE